MEQLQRTPEWYAARCGKVTASRVADVIGKKKGGGWLAPRAKYMEQIVAEQLTGRPKDFPYVWSQYQRGKMEPEALAAYCYFSDNNVELVGFVNHPTIGDAGASPDGLIGVDGLVEIKCLDADTHIRLLSGGSDADSVLLEHLPQIHFQMACTGREWCDFVSYSPFMPERVKVFTRRIPRNEVCITGLEDGVRLFLGEVETKLAAVLALCQKRAA